MDAVYINPADVWVTKCILCQLTAYSCYFFIIFSVAAANFETLIATYFSWFDR